MVSFLLLCLYLTKSQVSVYRTIGPLVQLQLRWINLVDHSFEIRIDITVVEMSIF